MPKRFLLDNHIYDDVVAEQNLVKRLTLLRETDQVEILQTHVRHRSVAVPRLRSG